jgi:RHS repeat-associated protein
MCKYAGSSTQPCQANGNAPYVWDTAGSLPLLLKEGPTAYVYGPAGLVLEQVNAGATYRFHHDQLGSTRLMTDSTGTSQATYTYDPYGGVVSSTGSITNPFRFGGQYQDAESGFYYLRARYYDPATAQFESLDPLVIQTGQAYSYAAGAPLNRTDPTGLWCAGVSLGWFAGAGILFVGAAHEYNQAVAVCSNGYVGGIETEGGTAGVGKGDGTQPGDQGAQGGLVSYGGGGFWSPNAQAVSGHEPGGQYALQGPFQSSTAGAGCEAGTTVGYAFAPGPNHVDVYSAAPLGETYGAGGAFYQTNTKVDWELNVGGGWNAFTGSIGSLWNGHG